MRKSEKGNILCASNREKIQLRTQTETLLLSLSFSILPSLSLHLCSKNVSFKILSTHLLTTCCIKETFYRSLGRISHAVFLRPYKQSFSFLPFLSDVHKLSEIVLCFFKHFVLYYSLCSHCILSDHSSMIIFSSSFPSLLVCSHLPYQNKLLSLCLFLLSCYLLFQSILP